MLNTSVGMIVKRTEQTLNEEMVQGSLHEVIQRTGPTTVRLCNGHSYHESGFTLATPKEVQYYKDSLAKETSKEGVEDSGGSCDYYKAPIKQPTTASAPYIAECNDVIEALNMTYAEANMFKEIWRSAAARTLGKLKANHSALRGAEKVEFFAKRNLIQKAMENQHENK
jgi:hypothetical protein